MTNSKILKGLKEFRFASDYSPEENFNLLKAFESFSFNHEGNMVLRNILFSRNLTLDTAGWEEFFDKYKIDIFRLGPIFYQNTKTDYFEDLSYIVDKELLPDSLKQFAVRDGKVIALPECINGLFLIFNKKILEELGLDIPETWDDFYNVLKEIKNRNPNLIPFTLHNLKNFKGWWAYYLIQPFLIQAGANIDELDIENISKSEEYKKVLEFLEKLIKEELLVILDEPIYESRSSVAFAKEKAVFILEGPWALQNMISHNKNIAQSIGVTVLENKKRGTVLGGKFLAIRSKSQNRETSLQFIQYLVQEGSFFRRTAQNCSVPGIKNFIPEENILLNEIESLLNKYGIIYPIRPNESEIWEVLGNKIGEDLKAFIN